MKGHLNKVTIFVLMLLFGFLVIMQMKALNMGAKHVLLNDIKTIQNNIQSETNSIAMLNAEIEQLKSKIGRYESSGANAEEIVNTMLTDIQSYKVFSGMTALEGQGVIVIIDDAQRALIPEEDPNNLIVHDADIQTIVNDLRNAGAEAISINGERFLMGHTRIVCNGPTITINEKQYAQPFIIKAIGNRKHLEAAVNAPGSYGTLLRDWGIFIEVNTTVSLRIPEYSNKIAFVYSVSKEN